MSKLVKAEREKGFLVAWTGDGSLMTTNVEKFLVYSN
jgi:hypothetical protein